MEAEIAGTQPIEVEVQEGKTYYWCACGRSKRQPFCDGAHKGTGISPSAFTAGATETMWLCACKRTLDKPRCDGSHRDLAKG
ncbi:MAG: CDGSH iron-sulfur domain-containing protein [Alphaproteobacteria bacterium]|nr:CDGSH iron-sulfur domain-containing protein [Alphaproteobacteria bacterium]